ncbi:MAG: hypothetical protein ABI690_29830 [Chloroflexota bacterium]
MAQRYDHLREKAIVLRTKQNMTLDEIVERLALPKTTIYHWIKDIPIPRTNKQSEAQRNSTARMQAKFAALRDAAYQQDLAEAPELLRDPTFRDFVVLYMAEGTKRDRNKVGIVNSDPKIVKLAHRCLRQLVSKNFYYALQYHADHDVDDLKTFWADLLNIEPEMIRPSRKSNSNQLSGRQFRSVHGLLSIEVNDTYLRAKMQAWMDIVKSQW